MCKGIANWATTLYASRYFVERRFIIFSYLNLPCWAFRLHGVVRVDADFESPHWCFAFDVARCCLLSVDASSSRRDPTRGFRLLAVAFLAVEPLLEWVSNRRLPLVLIWNDETKCGSNKNSSWIPRELFVSSKKNFEETRRKGEIVWGESEQETMKASATFWQFALWCIKFIFVYHKQHSQYASTQEKFLVKFFRTFLFRALCNIFFFSNKFLQPH